MCSGVDLIIFNFDDNLNGTQTEKKPCGFLTVKR